jgi:hypothetical protein
MAVEARNAALVTAGFGRRADDGEGAVPVVQNKVSGAIWHASARESTRTITRNPLFIIDDCQLLAISAIP